MFINDRFLMCAIALSRQRIVTSSAFKLERSSVTMRGADCRTRRFVFYGRHSLGGASGRDMSTDHYIENQSVA
jgi:hypothetical protein